MVADLRDRMIERNMSINLTEGATRLIAREGTDAAFGARPLRRAIQRLLEDPLSEQILEGKWPAGSIIDVDEKDGELVFAQGSGSVPEPRKRDSLARDAELAADEFRPGPCRRHERRLSVGRRGRLVYGSGGLAVPVAAGTP